MEETKKVIVNGKEESITFVNVPESLQKLILSSIENKEKVDK